MIGRRPRHVSFWVHFACWWLFYLGFVATGVIFAIWLFVGGHWLLGAVSSALTVWWTARVVIESGLARVTKQRIANRS